MRVFAVQLGCCYQQKRNGVKTTTVCSALVSGLTICLGRVLDIRNHNLRSASTVTVTKAELACSYHLMREQINCSISRKLKSGFSVLAIVVGSTPGISPLCQSKILEKSPAQVETKGTSWLEATVGAKQTYFSLDFDLGDC